MSENTGLSQLLNEYQQWKFSQTIINKFDKTNPNPVSLSKLQAGLENSLINSLQSTEKPNVTETLKHLDKKDLRNGLSYAQLELNNTELDVLSSIIKSTKLPEIREDQLSISTSDTQLKLGEFILDRNQYTDKAIRFVEENYNLQTAYQETLKSALRYASIYAKTRHIGPPQKVYDLFHSWGILNEGFASPFNARLLGKNNAKFYSLFKDTDEVFGSGGSFFDLEAPPNTGHWCLDPPFTEEIIDVVENKLQKWLDHYPSLGFILIIPASHKLKIKPDERIILEQQKYSYEGLDGQKRKLPVDVSINRFGEIKDFSAAEVKKAYT